MNEQHINPEPQLDLPPPSLGQGVPDSEAAVGGYTGEAAQAAAIEAGSTGNPVPYSPPSSQPQQQVAGDDTSLAQQAGSMVMGNSGMPAIADDLDLIEREWVHKAKEIVEHTQGDPFTRNKEMNKVKADYLKKRYNKDLKLEED